MHIGTALAAAFAVAFSFSSPAATAQSANDALMALKKLETRCETGISYRDYSSALGEAKFPVRLFVESSQAQSQPEVVASLNRAVEHYEFAGRLWNAKFTSDNSDRYLSAGFVRPKTALGVLIMETYPEAPMMEKVYPIDLVLPYVWAHASNELREASRVLVSTEPTDADNLKRENDQMRAELELEDLRRENEALKKQLETRRDES